MDHNNVKLSRVKSSGWLVEKVGAGPLRGAVKARRRVRGKWDDVTAGRSIPWGGPVRSAQQPTSEDTC